MARLKLWISGGAHFSPDRAHRYLLWREWHPNGMRVMFVGLNPSTADEDHDDPTVRRCLGFAHQWGYGSMLMANIFAFRATKPKDMRLAADPVGPDNDTTLLHEASRVHLVVAAWGNHGAYLGRQYRAVAVLNEGIRKAGMPTYPGGLQCFGVTKTDAPKHPLYLPGDAALLPLPWTSFEKVETDDERASAATGY